MRRFALSGGHGRVLSLVASALLFSLWPHALSAQSAQVGGGVELSTAQGAEASAQAEAAPAAVAPAADPAAEADKWRNRELRAGTTYYGPAGGFFVVDAGSSAPKSFRLQLMTDFFVKKDYLYNDDKNRYVGGALALGFTPIRYLELNAAVTTRSNRNSRTEPEVLQAVGDLHFDMKAWGEPVDGFALGGDLRLALLSGLDSVGTDSSATSVGMRANFAFDLRKLASREVPLQLRFNAGYLFNNSHKLIEETEQARLANIQEQSGTEIDARDEYRHLVRRDERLALGIDRVDNFTLAAGAEVPLELGSKVALHPIIEWGLEIPVNRQDFDCPYITDADGEKVGGTDSCLGQEGGDTWRHRITVGARLYPGAGFNLLAGVDIGIGGSTNFVQELAPNTPYRILLGAGYTADLAPKPPIVREVEKRVEVQVPVAPIEGRVRGTVVEQGAPGVVVANAKVSFPGRQLNALVAGADGTFVTYALAPGEVQLEVDAEGYRPGTCAATVPPEGGEVPLSCELVALPRVGSVVGQVLLATDRSPLANVNLALTGPAMRTVVTDEGGRFRIDELAPGDYTLRVEQEGYLILVAPVTVKVREESQTTLQLYPTPKNAAVKVRKDKIQIRGSIFFTTGTADIEARSEPLLTEIADVIMRTPELLEVEVQGHTDDVGTPEQNLELSQRRADAVKSWLVKAGVERDRLISKGYGMDQPIVPNVTPQNRSKNRRVEFVIKKRAGE